MLHSQLYGCIFPWVETYRTRVWILFCLFLLEKSFLQVTNVILKTSSGSFRSVIKSQPTSLSSCYCFSHEPSFSFRLQIIFWEIITCGSRVNTAKSLSCKILLLGWHWTTDDKFAKLYEVKLKLKLGGSFFKWIYLSNRLLWSRIWGRHSVNYESVEPSLVRGW